MKNLTSRPLAFGALVLTFVSLGCGNKLLGVAPSISVSPANLAFPETTVGTSTSVTVNVTNEGSATLAITSIKVASDPNSELSLGGLLTTDCGGNNRSGSTTLAPAECAQFVVSWSPAGVHMAKGTVEIDSSDTQNPAVTLSASGNSVANTCQCTSTQSCCDNSCVDSQTDVMHCGGCNPCAAGDTCVGGSCIPPVVTPPPDAGPTSCDNTSQCSGGTICCNRACVVDTSPGHTGVCPCTGTGNTSTFNANTIVIPMDECWQRGIDTTTLPSYCNTKNAKTTLDDAPLKAYGLVYFLLKHGVTVYVVIDPNKSTISAKDLTLSNPFDASAPVKKYNWSTGNADTLPDNTQQYIDYRGGPFLIDASQHDKVVQLFKSDPDFAQFRTANTITIHVATIGFQSVVAKSLNFVPSRVALLLGDNSGYTDILVNYLDSAGLNFAGAGGTPSAPGTIYDVLSESDFLPTYDQSKLKANGYKLLWSPHWNGASTQSNNTKQLATIAAYVNAGGDLFAECAAIGTLEGEAGGGGLGGGSAGTRFMSTTGMSIDNLNIGNSHTISGPFTYQGLSNVLLQIGDFPFAGVDGAISDFRPLASYNANVTQLISKTQSNTLNQLFTTLDQHAAGKGSVVYLGGHDYSYSGGYAGTNGLTAGSRVVLNTLFSLGANNVCTGN